MTVHTTATPSEKVILAGLCTRKDDPELFAMDMAEMAQLCRTAGAQIVETIVQNRDVPTASTFFGEGKVREMGALMKEKGCTSLVIDGELSPGQIRTIENSIEGKVIDRSQLILDIFAQHAKTTEAQIQVELAQMRTLYPRLTRAWTHFSQQVGGIGTRGPGEKQLELDRRLVQKKISDLKERLEKIEKSRQTQRKSRRDQYKVSLVGYTNVGKSSLLNILAGSDVLVENKLFATLDTATRRTWLAGIGNVTLTDTVGFLRKLPHHLVASFRSTLEVIADADLIVMVVDASNPAYHHQVETVRSVLADLKADAIPTLQVFNKSDLLTDAFARKKIELANPDALLVSALNTEDAVRLKAAIVDAIHHRDQLRAMDAIIDQKTKQVASQRPSPEKPWD